MSAEQQSIVVTDSPHHRRDLVLIAVSLVLVALNLRTTVVSLPPLLGAIRADIAMTGAVAGLLTAMPVLCMAWLAPWASRIAGRFGYPITTLAAVVLIAIGNGTRGLSGSALALIAATFVAGAGVSIAGVVVPAVVKDVFGGRQGAATGAYTVAMMLGAAMSATFSAPLATLVGSWRGSLAFWAIPALAAAVVWAIADRHLAARSGPTSGSVRAPLPWRSRPVWILAGFMSVQSALFYAYIGWLAPASVAQGWTPVAAGALLGVNSFAQLVAALILPALADRIPHFRALLASAVSFTIVGAVWLWAQPMLAPWVAVSVLGLGLGAGFALGLTRIVHYAADARASSRLTAVVFLVSYTAAAISPIVVGVLHDATGGFTVPFGLLVVLSLTQLAFVSRLRSDYCGTVT